MEIQRGSTRGAELNGGDVRRGNYRESSKDQRGHARIKKGTLKNGRRKA